MGRKCVDSGDQSKSRLCCVTHRGRSGAVSSRAPSARSACPAAGERGVGGRAHHGGCEQQCHPPGCPAAPQPSLGAAPRSAPARTGKRPSGVCAAPRPTLPWRQRGAERNGAPRRSVGGGGHPAAALPSGATACTARLMTQAHMGTVLASASGSDRPLLVESTSTTPPASAATASTCQLSRAREKAQCPACPSVDLK